MGEHYKVEMMATRASTIRRDYQCLTIEIGTDLSQAATALQSHVPPNAKVFLITDAPLDDVATIRAVLPTPENIIDEVKVDSVDVTELTAYRALQNLPDAQPVTPTAADSHLQRMEYASTTTQDQAVAGQPSRRDDDDWRTEASDMVNAYEAAVADLQAGATSDAAFRAELGDLDHHDPRERSGYASPSIPSSPFDQQRVSQGFAYLVLGQPSRPTFARQYVSPSGASGPLQRPAPAGNPTLVLSEALGLDQDLCESLKWQEMAKAQDLALLANLVTRALEGTKNRNLKPMLQRLVQDMAAKPKLAERVFIVLLGANESCDDRVSLALSKAQEEWLAQPVWDGALNDDLPKVIDIARQVFRRRFIEKLAKQKVEDINKERRAANEREHTEDVETLLAFLAGLHGPLELGGEKPDAEFIDFRISGVQPHDIRRANLEVLKQEGERFWDFLATWEPWQEVVLPHKFPNEVADIKKVLSDPGRPARLEREAATAVDKAGVPPAFRNDAITRTANQLGQDEELQLWLPLTEQAWRSQ